jgi:hypothetical protein
MRSISFDQSARPSRLSQSFSVERLPCDLPSSFVVLWKEGYGPRSMFLQSVRYIVVEVSFALPSVGDAFLRRRPLFSRRVTIAVMVLGSANIASPRSACLIPGSR